MRNIIKKQIFLLAAVLAVLGGCSKGPTDSPSARGRKEQQISSATDIIYPRTRKTDQNDANRMDNGQGGAPQREAGNYSTVRQTQMPDSELEKMVKVAITTGSTGTSGAIDASQLTKIDVKAENGVVTLGGPVGSEEEKQIIEKQVKGLKGVRQVVNNLQSNGAKKSEDPLVPRTGDQGPQFNH